MDLLIWGQLKRPGYPCRIFLLALVRCSPQPPPLSRLPSEAAMAGAPFEKRIMTVTLGSLIFAECAVGPCWIESICPVVPSAPEDGTYPWVGEMLTARPIGHSVSDHQQGVEICMRCEPPGSESPGCFPVTSRVAASGRNKSESQRKRPAAPTKVYGQGKPYF